MNARFDTLKTAVGPFSAAVDSEGAVLATAFGGRNALQARVPSLRLAHDAAALAPVWQQITAYFAGTRLCFSLAVRPMGSAFQQAVWEQLQRIPCGDTRTYGEVARALGRPSAARAVGRANATNPVCLLIPCHRVIGASGALTGFAFGEALKGRLLEHERTVSGHNPDGVTAALFDSSRL